MKKASLAILCKLFAFSRGKERKRERGRESEREREKNEEKGERARERERQTSLLKHIAAQELKLKHIGIQ